MALNNAKTAPPNTLSLESYKLIKAVVEHIRVNLENIKRVWGKDSPQYKSAATILDSYLNDNLKQEGVSKDDIADMLNDLDLNEKEEKGDIKMKTED